MSKCVNIGLMGMSGVGKSYLSRLLARKLNFKLLDLDVFIEAVVVKEGFEPQFMSDEDFLRIEKQVLVNLPAIKKTIIDPGGSIVYSPEGMAALSQLATIVYIKDDIKNIERRFKERGHIPLNLVGIGGKTFNGLFSERAPLYEHYADIIVTRVYGRENDAVKVVDEIISEWRDFCKSESKQ